MPKTIKTTKSVPATKPKVAKATKVTKVAKIAAVSGIKAPLYNLKGESLGDVALPKTVFETKVNDNLISVAIRVYRSNIRSAHAKVKDRGDVNGTTKKMWAQKGTGRARHGSAKAGIFVGGGIAHGPQGNENFTLKLNQKARIAATHAVLSKFAAGKSIAVIEDFKDLAPKTKVAFNFIDLLEKQNTTLANSGKIGIITSAPAENVKRAFANIPGLNYFTLKSVNLLNLADQNFLLFSREALKEIK